MYSIDDLERDWAKREEILKAIRKDRGKKYGSPEDTLGNVASFGWIGAVINHYECASRLKNIVNKLLDGEDIDMADVLNASRDAGNYAGFIEILIKRK